MACHKYGRMDSCAVEVYILSPLLAEFLFGRNVSCRQPSRFNSLF